MQSFSQRKGLKPIKDIIQKNGMDDDLRNSIWNLLDLYFWHEVKTDSFGIYDRGSKTLFIRIWMYYFKKPIDELSSKWWEVNDQLKRYYFSFTWNEIYDFIEFIANNSSESKYNIDGFISACNNIFVQETSGYRFINRVITDIISDEEISAVSSVLESPDIFRHVKEHISTALLLHSNRKNPDYRNSIKESVSAVEAICKIISGKDKTILGDALNIIEKDFGLHHALKRGFSSLYGYTNEADGIRHALMEDSNLDSKDAKFMLVACSAFVNYLIEKTAK